MGCPTLPSLVAQTITLLYPEAVLLVDDDKPEIMELDALLQQRVRPDDHAGSTSLHVIERGATVAADCEPVSSATLVATSAAPSWSASASGPSIAVIDRWCCCASTSVGASSAA